MKYNDEDLGRLMVEAQMGGTPLYGQGRDVVSPGELPILTVYQTYGACPMERRALYFAALHNALVERLAARSAPNASTEQARVDRIRAALKHGRQEADALRKEAADHGGDKTRMGRWFLGRAHGMEEMRRAIGMLLPIEWDTSEECSVPTRGTT